MRKAVILITFVILLASCATVKNVSDKEINAFLNNLIIDQEEIQKVTILQVDQSLEIKYWLKEDTIVPELRKELFEKTRDFMLLESTKKQLNHELKNNKPKYDGRMTIRFQKEQSQNYWVYSLVNPDSLR